MSTAVGSSGSVSDSSSAAASSSDNRDGGGGAGGIGGIGGADAGGIGFVDGLLINPTFWAAYGVVMAAMGTRLPMWSWPPKAGQVLELAFCVVVFAALAQPYTGRPVLASMRIHHVATVHRNTLLVGGFVVLVACEKPQAWAAGVDAVLLAGYLLLTDSLTVPPGVRRRTASPVFLIALVALIAGATALVALPASSGAYRPVLVAVAAAAAVGAALATAFGSAEQRRVGSAGEPKAETGPKKARDRSSE
jgi:hypothetical protein